MRRAHRLLAGLLTAGALLTVTAGCAQSVDPIERLGRKAAQRMNPSPSAPEARPAAVRGDHGAPGAMVVIACGRPRRPGDPGCVRRSAGGRSGRGRTTGRSWMRGAAGAPDVRNGPGTRGVLPVPGGFRRRTAGRHEGRELALRLTEC